MRKVRHGACTEALMPSWYGPQWVEIDSIGEFWNPIHLYLIFEKSSLKNPVWKIQFEKSSLKDQVLQTGFFAGYTGSKNLVWNWLKIQFMELGFSNLIFKKSNIDGFGYRLLNKLIIWQIWLLIQIRVEIGLNYRRQQDFWDCPADM